MDSHKKFYLIREDVLPESVQKTLKVKAALEKDPNLSIFEAVKSFDLSRSAYYKYKDTIFPIDDQTKQRTLTLLLHVDDNIGLLSSVLDIIAKEQGSVLTIHQSLPIKDKATITISLNAALITITVNGLLEKLQQLAGVNHAELLGISI